MEESLLIIVIGCIIALCAVWATLNVCNLRNAKRQLRDKHPRGSEETTKVFVRTTLDFSAVFSQPFLGYSGIIVFYDRHLSLYFYKNGNEQHFEYHRGKSSAEWIGQSNIIRDYFRWFSLDNGHEKLFITCDPDKIFAPTWTCEKKTKELYEKISQRYGEGARADELRWFYHVFGTQDEGIHGPLSLAEIQDAYRQGDVKDDDMVWHSDNKQPMVALRDSVLFAYLRGERTAKKLQ
jgi:hypothetical protein